MKKFGAALAGLRVLAGHRAVVLQFVLGLLAVVGGFVIGLDYYEWLAFIICIFLVVSMEIMNTAIERLCDRFCEEYDERIGIIKDMAAAGVLCSCLGALIVCLLSVLRRIV